MKKQINEIKRMQQLAGLIKENNTEDTSWYRDHWEGYVEELTRVTDPIELQKVGKVIMNKYPDYRESDYGLNISRDNEDKIIGIKGGILRPGGLDPIINFNFEFSDGEITNMEMINK
jgi:hypothetical protein